MIWILRGVTTWGWLLLRCLIIFRSVVLRLLACCVYSESRFRVCALTWSRLLASHRWLAGNLSTSTNSSASTATTSFTRIRGDGVLTTTNITFTCLRWSLFFDSGNIYLGKLSEFRPCQWQLIFYSFSLFISVLILDTIDFLRMQCSQPCLII